ncbi:MAG TPA: Zn-dependent hydrolase [Negativicutes bacterium]
MAVEEEWVINVIEQIAHFGEGTRGISRLAFSDADDKARKYVMDLMCKIGLAVRVDEIGNIIGRLEGDSDLPAVLTGSHLDTVPESGKYDGVVGVAGGLAAIKCLKERGILLHHPIELVVFVAEESSRFRFATMGSKAMIGAANIPAWTKIKDQDGVSLPQALAAQGLDIQTVRQAFRDKSSIKAFVELHIEQGRILEKEGNTIGVVDLISAPTRFKITVEGIAAHSGATPMEDRQDALVSAAMIILAIQEIALEQSDRGTVGTVGALTVHPGAMNVIPGLVEMWVDLRGTDHNSIIECLQDIKDAVSTIADAQETPVAIEMLSSEKPVAMHADIVQVIEDVCRQSSVSYQRMHSGAGHDAMNMARIAPTGMIFVPSRGGISHHPDEYTAPQDILTGINVLTEVLYQLAK